MALPPYSNREILVFHNNIVAMCPGRACTNCMVETIAKKHRFHCHDIYDEYYDIIKEGEENE